MSGLVTALFLGFRMMSATLQLRPLAGVNFLFSEWTWTILALTFGLALIYRFAMSNAKEPVVWSGSLIGGAASALLFVAASWASAFYVEQIVHLGATYGSIATVVVLLIWLSWNVNAVFFGGALATEVDLMVNPGRQARHQTLNAAPKPVSSQ
ncbi:MAG: YihY/virulence factor BrkB family protein [Caulobacteraceae bacterium]|nr:YihY/virulence factor BrkB family protein [Caulobacteraceae bacterium]